MHQLHSFSCWYVTQVLLAACLVRLLLSTSKAFAIKDGEHSKKSDEGKRDPNDLSKDPFFTRFWAAFGGFSKNGMVNDYWLPYFIGIAEFFAFPVAINGGRWEIIGGWLTLKTAGAWGTWVKSRTAFNRFLVGNLLSIGISYFWFARQVR